MSKKNQNENENIGLVNVFSTQFELELD